MTNFKNIYCIEKTTEFERVQKKEILPNELLDSRRIENHKNHSQFMDNFLTNIQKFSPNIQLVKDKKMKSIQPTKEDLVISCGGDGTFLACAQDYFDATLLGVNTNYLPRDPIFGSLGALTSINKQNLPQRIQQLLTNKYTLRKWKRLTAQLSKKKIKYYAVNDIFVGQKISYKTCYCHLESPKHQSEFSCSGILSCTGVGSHSWYRNAGGTPFGRSLDNFAYLVLNPNTKSPIHEYSEILTGQENIIICSFKDEIVIAFDSRETIVGKVNEKIKIFLDDKKPIKVINF